MWVRMLQSLSQERSEVMELSEFARLYYIQEKDTKILIVSLLKEPQQPTCEKDQPSDTTDKDE